MTPTANPKPAVVTRWTHVIARRWMSGVVASLGVAAVGLGVLFLTWPRYKAEARLRIGEPPPATGVSPSAGITSLLRPGGDPFSNDLELLDSRTVSEGTADDVALAVRLVAPRGVPRDSLVTALTTTRATIKARFTVTWEDGGAITVRETSPGDSLVARGRAGQPVTFGGVTAVFRPWRAGMPKSIEARTQLFQRAVRVTREALDIDRARRDANIVDIAFSDMDPGVALGVVDATVRHFIGLRTSVQRRESGQTVDSLRTVATRAAGDLAVAEGKLEALERRTHLVAPEAQRRAAVDRASQVSADLARSQAELAMLDRVLARVDTARDPSSAWADLLSYPRFLDNGVMGGVLNQLVGRQQQRTELITRRTGENRDLRVLDQQIASLDSTLRTLVRGYRGALAQQVSLAQAEMGTLDSALGAAPAASIELARAEREVKVLGDVMLLAEQRLHQEELREALTFANVQIIDPPALRDKPIWPPVAVGLGVLAALTLLAGVAAMALHEQSDPAATAAEKETAAGAPVLLKLDREAAGE